MIDNLSNDEIELVNGGGFLGPVGEEDTGIWDFLKPPMSPTGKRATDEVLNL